MPGDATNGMWYPQGGWAVSPVPIGTVGVEQWPDWDGSMRYYVQVGTPAWDYYQNQEFRRPDSDFNFVPRSEVNILPGPWAGESSVSVDPATWTTGKAPPPAVTEFVNDPSLGVVPVGVPTDQGPIAQIVNLPAGWVSKLLGPGSVNATTAQAVRATPIVFWGLLAWCLYRRFNR